MKLKPEIFVDVHEGDSELADRLKERNIGDVEIKSMVTGDVVIRFDGFECGFELKRGSDYSNSLHSGRLSDQVYRCIEAFDYPGLIVENWHPYVGDDTTESDLEKSVDMFRKSIRTFNRRIATFETKDMADTCDLLESIIKDIAANKFRYIRRKVILEESPDEQVVFLSSLANISVTRAGEILELFGSPGNAITHLDEWVEINGITNARLARIKDTIWKEKSE